VLALNCQRIYAAFMESPCNKICAYDPVRRICAGCGRTLDEIGGWAGLDDAERRRIMRELPQRLEALRRD
jgi:predicted Fe-S protein YdhL (DUF1289 family)